MGRGEGEGKAERKAAEKADKKRAKREHELREGRESHSQEIDTGSLEHSEREQSASGMGSVGSAIDAAVPTSTKLRLEVPKSSSGDLNSAHSASYVRITPLADASSTATPTVAQSTPDVWQSLSPLGIAAMLAVFSAVLVVLWVNCACCMAAARGAGATNEDEEMPPSSNRVWCVKNVFVGPNSHRTYSVSRPLLKDAEARAPICN